MKKQFIALMQITPKRYILFVIVFTLFIGYSIYKEEKSLIMTPTTHGKIIHLDIEHPKIASKYKIKSCIYDEECGYLQLCIVGAKDDNLIKKALKFQFYINDRKREDFSVTEKSSLWWWKKYLVVWIKDVSQYSNITIRWQNQTFPIYSDNQATFPQK